MKKKETTWEDVIDFAVKKKITPEEFTQILIDNNEEVGIDKKQLQVLKKTLSEMDEQKTRKSNAKNLHWSPAMARGSGTKLQATSRKLQATSRKLDKGPVLCYRIFKEKEI